MHPLPALPDLRVLLLPLPAFALLPFGGFVDKLRFSADEADHSRQRWCQWSVLGLAPGELVSSSGIAVRVQTVAEAVRWRDHDLLVVFGGRNAQDTQALAPHYRDVLRQADRAGLTLAAIDNASFLLAACGLLDDHSVSVHWRHAAEFRASFPRIRVLDDHLFVVDGKRATCAGGTAAIDLAVALLDRACGRPRALKGLADMLVDEARSGQSLLRSMDTASVASRPLARATALMHTHLGTHMSVDQLATLAGISRRQLDRRCHAHHGMSAAAFWQEMRLQQARWRLINSSHSLAQIAHEVGLTDASHLGRLFRRRFGDTPAAFRRAQRHGPT